MSGSLHAASLEAGPGEAGGGAGHARGARRLGPTLTGYVCRELLFPTGAALLLFALAVLIKNLLGYADWIVNRGLGPGAVAAIAAWQLVPVVAQTLPFAVLVGTLVGLGRLEADREVLAIETTGVASTRLLVPVLLFSLGASTAGLLLIGFAAPEARGALRAALERMVTEQPGATLRAGAVQDFGDRQLLAAQVSPEGDRLGGVLLWMEDLGETVFAARGEVEAHEAGRVRLTLEDAVVLGGPDSAGRHIRVERFQTELEKPPDGPDAGLDETLSAASFRELGQLVAEDGAAASRWARAERGRRLALSAAPLLFGLLATAIAIGRGRFSRAQGGVAGLLATVGYYGLLQLGDGLMRYPAVPVSLAVWLPNAVSGGVALLALARMRRSAGFAPIRRGERRTPAGVAVPADRGEPQRMRHALDRYVLGTFAQLSLAAFAVLLCGYLIVDVLERLQWFARHEAELVEVLRFYGARTPLLAARVVPMSLLAGAALTVGLLGASRELLGMESCGIWLGRALAPVLFLSALLVPLDFALEDALVPRTNALADRIKEEEIKDDASSRETAIWYRDADRILRVPRLSLDLGQVTNLVVYELGSDGLPAARVDAGSATHLGGGLWELRDARRLRISPEGIELTDAPPVMTLSRAAPAVVDPMHLSVGALANEIRLAEARGYVASAYRTDLHRKLTAPLACFLLPAIAVLLAVRLRPRPSPARSLVLSVALGVGYLLVGDVATSLGYGGQLPPAMAGWAPPFLAAVLGLGFGTSGRR